MLTRRRGKGSAYLRRVKSGETIIITEYGKPVGRIVPYEQSLDDQLAALQQAGLISWNGQKLAPLTAPAKARRNTNVADLLLEDRD